METEWTVLAQVLAPPPPTNSSTITEAAAANQAWLSLMRNAAHELDISDMEVENTLKTTIKYSTQCFTDLFLQIREMEVETSLDTYAWETMSESLVSEVTHYLMTEPLRFCCPEISLRLLRRSS
jgi:phosphatidylinositol 4-kinase